MDIIDAEELKKAIKEQFKDRCFLTDHETLDEIIEKQIVIMPGQCRRVEHPNGLIGIMYGKGAFGIYEKGKELFHTGNRNFNTVGECYEHLEHFKEFKKEMSRAAAEYLKTEERQKISND